MWSTALLTEGDIESGLELDAAAQKHGGGGVADVYAEEPIIVDLCDGSDEDSDYEADMEVESEEESKDIEVEGNAEDGQKDKCLQEGAVDENRLVVYYPE
ncbi:hypothetical protein E2562_038853 [Oryza meyeriana var. granulata]|uniref:Uncharacterized protein n=1 Tax=Oryza meyeriana var. granulata TaxID=110450 RepID=A0A6G1DT27_9ORYZ|nr:hypothetical protein E2562_038853 [Oryza meyeriana var. granulata]